MERKSRLIYEVIAVNNTTKLVERGGIRTTYDTATKWAKHNNDNNDGYTYSVDLANEDAITLKEYYATLKQ